MKSQIIPSINLDKNFHVRTDIHSENLKPFELPHRFESGAFIFLKRGEGDISINLVDYPISSNNVIMIMPGSIIQINNLTENFKAYFIVFPLQLVENIDLIKSALPILSVIADNPVITLKTESIIDLLSEYCSLLLKADKREEFLAQPEVIENMLRALFYAVVSFYQQQNIESEKKKSRKEEIFRQLLREVSRHYTLERSVAYYADKLCVTPKYLSFVAKSVSGSHVSDIIAKAVILDAKSKIKSTNMTILEISESLNFPNPSFFGKYFKKHVGVSPKQFRDNSSK